MKTRLLKQQIKILLPAQEHDRVRLASAVRRVPMAEFCRQAAVNEAVRLIGKLPFPDGGTVGGPILRRRRR